MLKFPPTCCLATCSIKRHCDLEVSGFDIDGQLGLLDKHLPMPVKVVPLSTRHKSACRISREGNSVMIVLAKTNLLHIELTNQWASDVHLSSEFTTRVVISHLSVVDRVCKWQFSPLSTVACWLTKRGTSWCPVTRLFYQQSFLPSTHIRLEHPISSRQWFGVSRQEVLDPSWPENKTR